MTEGGESPQNSAKISIQEMVILALSFISVATIVVLSSRSLRCVLEHRMTEATITLLAVLLGGAGVSLTKITSPVLQKILRCIYTGAALALIPSLLVMAFLPPPPKSDCAYLFTPTPIPLTVIPLPSPTPEPTEEPTGEPTEEPTTEPTEEPTGEPTEELTPEPTDTLTGKMAFPVYQGEQRYIYLADLDGVEPTFKKIMEDASEPSLSPDGSQIAFRSWNDATRGLMVMNVNDDYPRRVSRSLEDACPYWALGESLVFHSTKEGSTPRLYTVGTWEGAEKVDSVQGVKPDTDPAYGRYPAWVPDERIVYEHFDKHGNFFGLCVMNSDGSNPMPITDHPGDTMPSVSHRGDKVAFMSDRNGHWEVYTVSIDGSELKQLTDSGNYNSGLPTWSPDGGHIAFVSERGNHWAIWVMKSDGSGKRKLFDLDGTLAWWERISWAPGDKIP